MFNDGQSLLPGGPQCGACETITQIASRRPHPRLPWHEIRLYLCPICGLEQELGAPVINAADRPTKPKAESY